VPKHKNYTPTHRQQPAPGVPKKALRNTLVLSSIAVAATGTAVAGGVVAEPSQAAREAGVSADLDHVAELSGAVLADRNDPVVSRSDRRDEADPAKAATLAATDSTSNAFTRTEDIGEQDPRAIGRALLSDFGFGADQFSCLDSLWTRESNWNVNADNPSSSAYGIPQALPGSKMSSSGADWSYNPVTQITWGLGYIADRYGSPCSAWGHSQSVGWY
jgi:hypothetical protein